tara:strand:- start:86 stop:1051 length:966 start_codon:yes stop_codon:yes gene_type:complete
MKKSFKRLSRVLIWILSFFVWSCTAFRGPKYPEIIYNNKQPLISVTYEYGEIQIVLPIKYEGAVPDNILFKVFANADTLNPIISILQESPNEFRTTVPQGVLDVNNKTNMIKIIPQDINFDPVEVRFKGINFGRITLLPKIIRSGQLVVTGQTLSNSNDTILENVEISLQNFDNTIFTTFSNKKGFFQIAIPGEYKYAEHLRLVAGNNIIFKPFIQKLDFSKNRKIKLKVKLGPSRSMKGPLFITNKNNVQFKKYPDVGSEILFLLDKGEILSIDRITPGAYFGYIEVPIGNNKNIKMEGWVDRADLIELNINDISNNIDN